MPAGHPTMHPATVGCTDCGLVQVAVPPERGCVLECVRCSRGLRRSGYGSIEIPLAFAISGLVLFWPAALAPLMSVASFGTERSNWLPSGVEALWSEGYVTLASLVGLSSVVIPLVYLTLLV